MKDRKGAVTLEIGEYPTEDSSHTAQMNSIVQAFADWDGGKECLTVTSNGKRIYPSDPALFDDTAPTVPEEEATPAPAEPLPAPEEEPEISEESEIPETPENPELPEEEPETPVESEVPEEPEGGEIPEDPTPAMVSYTVEC